MSIQEYLQDCKHGDAVKVYEELSRATEKENIKDLIRTSIRPTVQEDWVRSGHLIRKLNEEVLEFIQARSSENVIEEFFDVIQCLINYVDYLKIDEESLKEGIKVHNEKLLKRGWEFKNF